MDGAEVEEHLLAWRDLHCHRQLGSDPFSNASYPHVST